MNSREEDKLKPFGRFWILEETAEGEWRGLAVSIEDCHSKGQRFKSRSVLFFSQEVMLSNVSLASRKTDKTGQDTRTGGFNEREAARRETERKEFESGTKQYDEGDGSKNVD